MAIKLIAFDLFGTVFDLQPVLADPFRHEEIEDYANHLKEFYDTGEWKPLKLPDSWVDLKPYPDARTGIERLREDFTVVTLSNCPLGLSARMLKKSDIVFDAITPLELFKTYKTRPEAYKALCTIYDVKPSEIAMVTGNKHFGDLEASAALGMTPVLIRALGADYRDIMQMASLFVKD